MKLEPGENTFRVLPPPGERFTGQGFETEPVSASLDKIDAILMEEKIEGDGLLSGGLNMSLEKAERLRDEFLDSIGQGKEGLDNGER